MKKKRVVIVGCGACGLMAGIKALHMGAAVTILEKKDKPGKKILATGNGRCNFTNSHMNISCYHGDAFAMDIISRFDEKAVIDFFTSIGIFPTEKNGYFYPITMQALTVAELLTEAFESLGGKLICDVDVRKIVKDRKGFCISGEKLKKIPVEKGGKKKQAFQTVAEDFSLSSDAVILACGGKASPKLGSDGSGYRLAKSFGHSLVNPLPALCGINCREDYFKDLSGVRIQARVDLFIEGKKCASDKGELQLTDYGISGIPVFQVSRHASRALDQGKKVEAELLFYPEISDDIKKDFLNRNKDINKRGFYPDKLLKVLERVSPGDLLEPLKVSCVSMQDFDRAQVTTGGIPTGEVNQKTLESKLCQGLYLCGELLDVDGICGGYNLQWAWSSGYVAGISAAEERR